MLSKKCLHILNNLPNKRVSNLAHWLLTCNELEWLNPQIYPTIEGGLRFQWEGSWKGCTEYHDLTFLPSPISDRNSTVHYYYWTDYPDEDLTDDTELDCDITWQNPGAWCIVNTLNFHHQDSFKR